MNKIIIGLDKNGIIMAASASEKEVERQEDIKEFKSAGLEVKIVEAESVTVGGEYITCVPVPETELEIGVSQGQVTPLVKEVDGKVERLI